MAVSKAFNDFMDSWRSLLEESYGHGQATADAHLEPALSGRATAGAEAPELEVVSGASESILDDWIPEFSYICKDCGKTFSARGPLCVCELCVDPDILCSECLGFHVEAGHVTDAMAQMELEKNR